MKTHVATGPLATLRLLWAALLVTAAVGGAAAAGAPGARATGDGPRHVSPVEDSTAAPGLDSALLAELAWAIGADDGSLAWLNEDRGRAEDLALAAMFAPEASAVGGGPGGDNLVNIGKPSPAIQARIDSARAKIEKLDDNLLAGDFDPDNLAAALPLGWRQQFGEGEEAVSVALAITESRLKPAHTEVDLVLELRFANSAERPIFIADGIPWSRAGGFTGEVTLELLADWGIPLTKDRRNKEKAKLLIKAGAGTPESRAAGEGTFVTVTCGEVVAARLNAELLLSRDLVVPVTNGVPDSAGRVRTSIAFDLSEGGLYASTRIAQSFAFPERPDLVFEVGEVTVDYSSTIGSGTAVVPAGYRERSPSHVGRRGRLLPSWQGVYVADVSAQLRGGPTDENGQGLGARAEVLIIDRKGLTVDAAAINPLPLGRGKLGNWDFSVDTIGIRVIHSNLESARLAGVVKVPLLSKQASCGSGAGEDDDDDGDAPATRSDCLAYGGLLGVGGFAFTLELEDDYCIPAWKSDAVRIDAASRVTLGKDDEGAYGQALLHGEINLDTGGEGMALKVEGLRFDNLALETRAPYFSTGRWDVPDVELRLGFLAGRVRDISVRSRDLPDEGRTEARLSFVLGVELEDKLKFNAEGGIAIVASAPTDGTTTMRWRHERTRLGYFSVDASTPAFALKGRLATYGQDAEDPEWGKGFYGSVTLRLKAVDMKQATSSTGRDTVGLGFGAVAQFGKLTRDGQEHRYFLVDVMAYLEEAHIPFFPPFELHGIGGGVYRNISPAKTFSDLTEGGTGDLAQAQAAFPVNDDGLIPDFLGETLSGRRYTPRTDDAIGFYIQLLLGTADKSTVIGGAIEVTIVPDSSFAITLNAGVTLMSVEGEGTSQQAASTVSAYAEIALIRSQSEGWRFTATAAAYVMKPSRLQGVATGAPTGVPRTYVNPVGFAGQLQLHVSRDEWYLWVGAPTSPVAVRADLYLAQLQLEAYLCVGSNVPNMPRLHPKILRLTGARPVRESSVTDLANAKGIAFGASLNFEENRKHIWKRFYYDVYAFLGFDVNVRNYAGQTCHYARGGGAPGFDGWYGAGRVYAGIDLKIWKDRKKNGRKDRATIEAGALLRMRGPNPMYVGGSVRGKIKVGFIKLKFRAGFEAGKQC